MGNSRCPGPSPDPSPHPFDCAAKSRDKDVCRTGGERGQQRRALWNYDVSNTFVNKAIRNGELTQNCPTRPIRYELRATNYDAGTVALRCESSAVRIPPARCLASLPDTSRYARAMQVHSAVGLGVDAVTGRGHPFRSAGDRTGTLAAILRKASDFLYVTMPAKLICSPSSTQAAAVSALPVNECITPRSGARTRASCSIASVSASQSRMWTMNGKACSWASRR